MREQNKPNKKIKKRLGLSDEQFESYMCLIESQEDSEK